LIQRRFGMPADAVGSAEDVIHVSQGGAGVAQRLIGVLQFRLQLPKGSGESHRDEHHGHGHDEEASADDSKEADGERALSHGRRKRESGTAPDAQGTADCGRFVHTSNALSVAPLPFPALRRGPVALRP
jgi:hypothetical protein